MLLLFQILTAAAMLAGITLTVYGVFSFPGGKVPEHRRFAKALGIERQTVFEHPLLSPVVGLALAITQRTNLRSLRNRIERDLNASGNPSGYSADEYLAICLTSGVALALGVIGFETLTQNTGWVWVSAPVMLSVGFAVPLVVLAQAADRRVDRIATQLPYTVDLIALVMEAGSGFIQAAETLIHDQPEDDLNQELKLAIDEMGFGTPRAEALRRLGERVPLESLRSIIGAVNQADMLGTPLASILKLQADMLRNRRSVQAEKVSASASLKILVPSMLIMMAVVAIVFAPLIVRFVRGDVF